MRVGFVFSPNVFVFGDEPFEIIDTFSVLIVNEKTFCEILGGISRHRRFVQFVDEIDNHVVEFVKLVDFRENASFSSEIGYEASERSDEKIAITIEFLAKGFYGKWRSIEEGSVEIVRFLDDDIARDEHLGEEVCEVS